MSIASSFLLLAIACAPKAVPPNIAGIDGRENAAPVPTPEPFVFGPGDTISVKVWRHSELDMTITIAPDGGITFPLIGRIQAQGMTYSALVSLMERELKVYYNDASVAVNVGDVANQKVLVIGEVRSPQVIQISSDLSIMEALTRSGGINPDARTDNILLIRGGLPEPEVFTVDVDAIYSEGDFSQLIYLQRGDIVVVPPKTIVNTERFFRRIQGIVAPFLGGSAIYRNVVSSGAQGTSSALE